MGAVCPTKSFATYSINFLYLAQGNLTFQIGLLQYISGHPERKVQPANQFCFEFEWIFVPLSLFRLSWVESTGLRREEKRDNFLQNPNNENDFPLNTDIDVHYKIIQSGKASEQVSAKLLDK